MTVVELGEDVERLIASYSDAAMEYATKVKRESDLEADRCNIKADAIRRIMAGVNPLNGKPHSVSSAEAVVESDPEYRAYLATMSETVFAKNMARAAMESFRLRVLLAISLNDLKAGLV